MLYRNHLQMVFQDSFDAVDPRLSAEQIVSEPLYNFFRLSRSEIDQRVLELLKRVGIDESEKGKFPQQFSGGQLQRICISRSLAADPQLLVLDEPLSSLDVSVQAQILNLLNDLKEEYGLSYILISHDLEAVYYLADAIAVMYGGRIMEQIDEMEKFHQMVHPYTLRLLSSTSAYRHRFDAAFVHGNETKEIAADDMAMMEIDTGCPYRSRCPLSSELCREAPRLRMLAENHWVACHHR